MARGDSSAALGAAQRLSSPSPAMNLLGAELALLLEREDCADVEGSHIPGKLNVCADYLSRMMLKEIPKKPQALGETKVREITRRRAFALKGFGPGPRPELWGKASMAAGAEAHRARHGSASLWETASGEQAPTQAFQ